MPIQMLNLQPLTLNELPLLREYQYKYPRETVDYNLCNLMTWGKIYRNHYTIWRNHLVLVNPKYAYIFYPVGPGLSSADLRELLDLYRCQEPEAELILIPGNWRVKHPDLEDYFVVREERDWEDYVYSVEKMVNLSGKKLAKKKNLISQFSRAYPDYRVLPLTADKHGVVLRFTEKWKRERNAEGIYLNTELQAIRNTLEMWEDLPVEGLIICHHNLISAYSVFSRQTEDMATIHFEKFDPDMKGSAQIINWETAKYLQSNYLWVNREQDMGLEGLRQAKMTYLPERMLKFVLGTPR